MQNVQTIACDGLLQAVIHGMLFAFIYLVLQKRQVLSEGKGDALFSAKISNLLLLLSVVFFIVRLFIIDILPQFLICLQDRLHFYVILQLYVFVAISLIHY